MRICEMAPAKVNLFLQVMGKRPDGYHELVTIFQAVSLYDKIELELSDSGVQLTCNVPSLAPDRENLAYRAAALLLPRTSKGVIIRLNKAIPWQAGLGGGSSDAAAVLRGLNELWEIGLSTAELATLAGELGSDVPFFIYGGTALGTGRGDLIRPLSMSVKLNLLLVKPPFGLSTPSVFQAYQSPLTQQTSGAEAFLELLAGGDPERIAKGLRNDLEAAAFQLRPELAELKTRLLQQGALGCLLSGSGSCLFAVLPQDHTEGRWLEALPQGYQAFFVHA